MLPVNPNKWGWGLAPSPWARLVGLLGEAGFFVASLAHRKCPTWHSAAETMSVVGRIKTSLAQSRTLKVA